MKPKNPHALNLKSRTKLKKQSNFRHHFINLINGLIYFTRETFLSGEPNEAGFSTELIKWA